MLRINDRVVIGSRVKPHKIKIDEPTALLIDMKWNLGLVRFNNGQTEWIDLKRIYKAIR
jgi:hypothetical protein